MNFSRQLELYDAENSYDMIDVIGAGATGSWVTLLLSKLGVRDIIVHDMDVIELHNIPNQFYDKSNLGMFKAARCVANAEKFGSDISTIVGDKTEITMENYVDKVGSKTVFCLVDSMKARKELFEAACKYGNTELWIETRMGLTGYRIYLVHLDNQKEIDKYMETLYSDDEAEVSACGSSQSVITTAMQCASHAVGLWLAEKNNAEYVPNEIIFDVHSSFILSRQFDKKEGVENE